ncbi:hypothetical protein HPB50_009193 [Hyalomma asiaticum]|uniref:Uncharacterized protein n=1 Tax=Hyalomma asiaticum TaxID=266040 RepID=A0ACB7SDH4_HYAAI|nr:hypothetical protein HPB50_009193 [Hyalomma asiaticum]
MVGCAMTLRAQYRLWWSQQLGALCHRVHLRNGAATERPQDRHPVQQKVPPYLPLPLPRRVAADVAGALISPWCVYMATERRSIPPLQWGNGLTFSQRPFAGPLLLWSASWWSLT